VDLAKKETTPCIAVREGGLRVGAKEMRMEKWNRAKKKSCQSAAPREKGSPGITTASQ